MGTARRIMLRGLREKQKVCTLEWRKKCDTFEKMFEHHNSPLRVLYGCTLAESEYSETDTVLNIYIIFILRKAIGNYCFVLLTIRASMYIYIYKCEICWGMRKNAKPGVHPGVLRHCSVSIPRTEGRIYKSNWMVP